MVQCALTAAALTPLSTTLNHGTRRTARQKGINENVRMRLGKKIASQATMAPAQLNEITIGETRIYGLYFINLLRECDAQHAPKEIPF